MEETVLTYEALSEENRILKMQVQQLLQAEESVRKMETIHSKMVANIGDVIVIIDANGINRYKSPNIEKLFGWKPEEVVGKSTWENVHPDDLESAQDFFRMLFNLTGISKSAELRYRCKNGDYRYIEFTGVNLLDDPDINGILGNYYDITDRKVAEKELFEAKERLEESEDKYRALYVNAPLSYQSLDGDGCFIDVNPTWLSTLGYEREEVIGSWYGDYLHPDYVEHFRVNFPAFKKRGYVSNIEFKLRRKDNNYIYVSFEGCASYTPTGEFKQTYCVFKDISKQKVAEEELLKSKEIAEENEQKYRSLFENSTVGIVIVHPDTAGFVEFNDQVCSQLGYTKEEFGALTIFDIEAEESKDETKQRINFVMENGCSEFDTKQRAKNGDIVDIHVIANIIEISNKKVFHCVWRDITEQKRNESQLLRSREIIEESELKFRNAFQYSGIGMAMLSLNFNFIEANRVLCELWEYSEEELKGMTFKDLTYEEDRSLGLDDLKKLVSGEKDFFNVSKRYINKSGKIVWANTSVAIIRNISKEPLYFVAQVQDISKQVQYQEEIIAAKEKAEENEKLKTAFLQNMSHEIRTPLNAISGFSGLLNKPGLSEKKQESFISIIQNSSKQLISIVSDILTISSLETNQEKLNIEKVSINSIIIDLLSIFKQQSINQAISLYAKKELSDLRSEIYTDKTKLTQILTNLISNSLKFTHTGFIEFGYALQGSMVEFFVKDSGIGIKKEFHEKIFERFRQADLSVNKKYGGTGLGLSISKSFTELLGGEIRVESEPDKGSVFYFTIPYRPVNSEATSELPLSKKKKAATVLIAEDEEYNFLYIEELLADLDLHIIHAKDGQETIEICRATPGIDLILMDIKMPILDGYTAANEIKKFLPDLPVIAQSAYALEHEIERYNGVFDDYITKPIDEDVLIQKLEYYLGK